MPDQQANIQDNKIQTLTAEAVLHQFMATKQPLLLAINHKDLKPRLLTATDDKVYLVLFSTWEQVQNSASFIAQPINEILQMASSSQLDGIIINPWNKRITLPLQQVRHIYYQYYVQKHIVGQWWNSPLHTEDYEMLMWEGGEPYDEQWLADFLEAQNRQVVNVAWWAKEQHNIYKKPPIFMQIWLAFYGLYWLQTIFTAGLNTLYYKEMDEASIYLGAILSVGIYFIFKYMPRFNDWWYTRETKKQEALDKALWEAGAEERERQRQFEEAVKQKAQELIARREQEEQFALQELASACQNSKK